MSYSFNPHRHVKIWLSSNRDLFMNFENQKRLIEMREKNPNDEIHLVFDSSLLNPNAQQELKNFCSENNFTPIDAHHFSDKLIEKEATLYKFYKDEIYHLREGGNLAVASDILRLLSPVYCLGTYTDFDVPIETTGLDNFISVETPLLLNIGSLKIGKREFILVNNDCVAVVDPKDAAKEMEKLHDGLITKLSNYKSDYIEKTESTLDQGKLLNRTLVTYMKNRAEAYYIQKSTDLADEQRKIDGNIPSRALRAYIKRIMTDHDQYLNFHKKSPSESQAEVIQRLRNGLREQLGFVKWLFFGQEYQEISRALALDDQAFVAYMMKKERSLYLKSIVICTTGPLEIVRSLFGKYVADSNEFTKIIQPISFSHYGLQNYFKSKNSIPLHENPLGMLRFLGVGDGELNDSPWLEEGLSLQEQREKALKAQKDALTVALPAMLDLIKANIQQQINNLDHESTGLFSFLKNTTLKARKKAALEQILNCFYDNASEFNISDLRHVLTDLREKHPAVFSGYFSNRTRTIIEGLENLCHDAIVLRVAKKDAYGDKKLSYAPPKEVPIVSEPSASVIPTEPEKDKSYARPKTVTVTNPGRYSVGMFGKQISNVDAICPEVRATSCI